jgi:hypothetical protein
LPVIKTVSADDSGRFDFGAVKPGHYTLAIDDGQFSDSFDVEIKAQGPPTVSVMIDVSPVSPDCKGGHKFIVKTQ